MMLPISLYRFIFRALFFLAVLLLGLLLHEPLLGLAALVTPFAFWLIEAKLKYYVYRTQRTVFVRHR